MTQRLHVDGPSTVAESAISATHQPGVTPAPTVHMDTRVGACDGSVDSRRRLSSTGRIRAVMDRRASRYARGRIERMLADVGVRIGGHDPWDLVVHDETFFGKIWRHGMLGAGEAYVDGLWDCVALDELAARIARSGMHRRFGVSLREIAHTALGWLVNRQSLAAAAANGRAHYDIGDDLYAAMLGPTLVYSCGYWRAAKTLEDAQRAKHELVCAKLQLEPRQLLLDVGCGYGELAKHAVQHHGVQVVGITNSRNQAELARERCAGLPIEIRVQDYREIHGQFDRIASIGVFEHVGVANHRKFFEKMRRCLKPDGLLLLHTIGGHEASASFDPWMDRHIFPGALIPSAGQIVSATSGLVVLEDWHNFGVDYDRTLMEWWRNFERAWPSLEHYGATFRRKWRYYLMTCAGGFRARLNHAWQIVFSPHGVYRGYRRPFV